MRNSPVRTKHIRMHGNNVEAKWSSAQTSSAREAMQVTSTVKQCPPKTYRCWHILQEEGVEVQVADVGVDDVGAVDVGAS